ncbi:YihY/virulence factor BrkB family protein [Pseudazoarcus pumilus]|uniref:YihY/virulence factor BrkB family protein n=1 Tax=Pseudazoarcus pumilus TaxID=2067960 RepID=A0A2I6S7M1_9RHOO|nr:YihY/virulence factor BrkB family protein [Pseudazoarcus pumilus]
MPSRTSPPARHRLRATLGSCSGYGEPAVISLGNIGDAFRRVRDEVVFWYRVVRDSIKLWLQCNAFSYAGSLAFYTLFSLAPVVIIAVTLMGLVFGEDAARGEIFNQLQDIMGAGAAQAIENAVLQSRPQESGLMPTLLGFGALFLGATTVFAQMQFSLNVIWGVAAKPGYNGILLYIKNRVLSLTVVLAIGFILLVSLSIGVAVSAALKAAENLVPAAATVLGGLEVMISLALVVALFATIFKVLPDVVLGWRDVLIGAIVTAVLFSFGRFGIALYLAHTATASTYGAAGSVVLILLWVYYSSLLLLYGAAFTKVHFEHRGATILPRNSAVVVRRELIAREELAQS